MMLEKYILDKQWKAFQFALIDFDPYKGNYRQCNGRCPRQKFDKIKIKN